MSFAPLTPEQIQRVDPKTLKELRQVLQNSSQGFSSLKPYQKMVDVHKEVYRNRGLELLSEGKVGCLLMAGGQGTRLGFQGPKGCFPITPVKGKTLFHYFADKVKAASVQANQALKMAVMTSFQNHAATLAHFLAHDNFGLSADQLSFFQQGKLPLLTPSGDLFLEASNQIAFGPDGNGSCIESFFKSPIAAQWKEQGILYVMLILVDNPLADPFDPYLIGAHAAASVDVTLKCILREDPEEKFGLVVENASKPKIPQVIEYLEAPPDAWEGLTYPLANISLFCFSFSFLSDVAYQKMPLHKAFKKATYLDSSGSIIKSNLPCAWKFERFIFDSLAFATSAQAAVYPRELCFAPLKEEADVKRVKQALTSFDQRVLKTITGNESTCLEIDPLFYYPTDALVTKWKGSKVPDTSYVEA